jgi:hypothetical protein
MTLSLAISCMLVTEVIRLDDPDLLHPILVYAAIIAPVLCQFFPANVARWAWVPALGIFLLSGGVGSGWHEANAHVWLEIILLAALLVAYAMLVHRLASWEYQVVRALSSVSRSDLAVADAVERERLKRCEGLVALCLRHNQPLSILHLNWVRQGGELEDIGEWSFASQFERLSVRESVLQRVGAAIRNSDIVLSDGTQCGLFVICPITHGRGAEVLGGRLGIMLQREFAVRAKHSVVSTENDGFDLAQLMIAARAG